MSPLAVRVYVLRVDVLYVCVVWVSSADWGDDKHWEKNVPTCIKFRSHLDEVLATRPRACWWWLDDADAGDDALGCGSGDGRTKALQYEDVSARRRKRRRVVGEKGILGRRKWLLVRWFVVCEEGLKMVSLGLGWRWCEYQMDRY